MLYIKFDIKDSTKFEDFQKLYEHMDNVRQPGFKFEEPEPTIIDWDNLSKKETDEAYKKLIDSLDEDPADERYKSIIPDYANDFLEKYLGVDNDKLGVLGIQKALSIFNYLEFDFEVYLTRLEKQNEHFGIIEYETDNFPYGGIDRFLMVMKAFELQPKECFDGFTIFEFKWKTDYEYEPIEFPEKTKEYLNRIRE
ncbi:hypothetical protein [Cyclobacterium amurskyense]|uniref:Uncharacterized protein n=1 Tax=Cyclobacterium amurskyense TaxID=320787 RepID=A0A0H4PGG8_9BACT|nr:hypothetical protein [Cyclobacterium amurskyense]AKP53304.1 hypothetical protein CA2015_3941 [Cyclobacterium amurskyense]|tara:strand:+ start:2151 stop:2738 length:588 start_codon:yes stop_codon:yes gene_type:complete